MTISISEPAVTIGTMTSAALAPILGRAVAVVPTRSPIPVLGCALLERISDVLSMTVTDLTCWAGETIAAPGPDWPGGCVDIHRFNSFIKSLPRDAEIKLAADETRLIVSAAGAEAAFTLIAAGDFPRFTIAAADAVTSEPIISDLAAALGFCLPAVPDAREESRRFYLCGAFLDPEGSVTVTDGSRLHRHASPGVATPPNGIILPTPTLKALLDLLRSDDRVSLAISTRSFTATGEHWTLCSKVINATYPDYRRVLPPRVERPVTVERAALKLAAQRVADIGSEKAQEVKLWLGEGALAVTGSDATARVRSVLSVAAGPPEIRFALNTRYLLAALAAIDTDQVELHLIDESTAAWICAVGEADDGIVVMPMRADWE